MAKTPSEILDDARLDFERVITFRDYWARYGVPPERITGEDPEYLMVRSDTRKALGKYLSAYKDWRKTLGA